MKNREKLQEELIREYEKLIKLCNSREFFNIPSVNILKDKLSALKSQEQSVQMPSEMLTDKKIEEHFKTQHYDNKNGHHYRINKDRIFGAKWYRDWMREQAKPEIQMPTKEQIIEAAYKKFPYDKDGIPDSHSYSFCQGAEYAIKQAKPIDLRSELIQFLSESIIELPKGKDCIDLIEEYLSQK